MLRRFATVVSTLSALRCAAALGAWVWAPGRIDYDFQTSTRTYTVRTTQRHVWLDVAEGRWSGGRFGAPPGQHYRLPVGTRRRLPGGFEYERSSTAADPKQASQLYLFIPYWSLVTATGLLPALWVAGAARRRLWTKRRAGSKLCPVCGYDVRASPDRCPECGTSPSGAA